MKTRFFFVVFLNKCLPTVLFRNFYIDNIGTCIWINVKKKKKKTKCCFCANVKCGILVGMFLCLFSSAFIFVLDFSGGCQERSTPGTTKSQPVEHTVSICNVRNFFVFPFHFQCSTGPLEQRCATSCNDLLVYTLRICR